MITKNLFLTGTLLLALTIPVHIFSQEFHRVAVDLEAGGSLLTNSDVKQVFSRGLNITAGPKIAVLKNHRLWIRINGGVQWFAREVQDENEVRDNLRVSSAGAQAQYKLLDSKISLLAIAGADYNWCANFFSAKSDYDFVRQTYDIERSDKYLQGNGASVLFGLRGGFSNFYINLNYKFFKPTLQVHPSIVKSALDEGIIIPSEYPYNFSSINFAVGYQLNLSK